MSGWTYILAAPAGEDLSSLLYIGLLVVLSLLGTIFGRKKQGPQPTGKPPVRRPPVQRAPRPPQPTRRAPTPARPAERPPVARPTLRQPEPPAPIQALPRPTPARPARRVSRDEIVRQQRDEASHRAVPVATVEEDRPEPLGEPVEAPKRPTASTPQATVGDRLSGLLRSRTDLQAGLVLSEILGPPLALRDQSER